MKSGTSAACIRTVCIGGAAVSRRAGVGDDAAPVHAEGVIVGVAFDMECLTDSEGNTYDYAFGLNWSGVINDWRTETYGRGAYADSPYASR